MGGGKVHYGNSYNPVQRVLKKSYAIRKKEM